MILDPASGELDSTCVPAFDAPIIGCRFNYNQTLLMIRSNSGKAALEEDSL